MEDPIRKLLESTGLTCDELLRKLQDYKCLAVPDSKGESPTTGNKTEEAVSSDSKLSEGTSEGRCEHSSSDTSADVDSTSGVIEDNDALTIKDSLDVEKDLEDEEAPGSEEPHLSCEKCKANPCHCQLSTNNLQCSPKVDNIYDLSSSLLPKEVNKLFNDSDDGSEDNTDFFLNEIALEIGSKCTNSNSSSDTEVMLMRDTKAKCLNSDIKNQMNQEENRSSITKEASTMNKSKSESENDDDDPESIANVTEGIVENIASDASNKSSKHSFKEEKRCRKTSQADEVYCNEISSTEEDDAQTPTPTNSDNITNNKENSEDSVDKKNTSSDNVQDTLQLDEDIVSSSIIDNEDSAEKIDSAFSEDKNDPKLKKDIEAESQNDGIPIQTNGDNDVQERSENKGGEKSSSKDGKRDSNDLQCINLDGSLEEEDQVVFPDKNNKSLVNLNKEKEQAVPDEEAEPVAHADEKDEGHLDRKNKIAHSNGKMNVENETLQETKNGSLNQELSEESAENEDLLNESFSSNLNESLNSDDSQDVRQDITTENYYEYVNDDDVFNEEDDVFKEDEDDDSVDSFSLLSGTVPNTKNTESDNTTESNFVEVTEQSALSKDDVTIDQDNAEDPLSLKTDVIDGESQKLSEHQESDELTKDQNIAKYMGTIVEDFGECSKKNNSIKTPENSAQKKYNSEGEDSSKESSKSEDEADVLNSENEDEKVFLDDQIRDILKLQLSSLRNRKKKQDFQIDSKDVLNKVVNLNPKKKLASEKITEMLSITENKKSETLIEMSDETNLLILDVIGGVGETQNDSASEDNLNSNDVEKIPSDNEEEIKLTKTNDITKIKGWKNKRFSKDIKTVPEEKEISNPVEELRKIISKSKDETKSESSVLSTVSNFKVINMSKSTCDGPKTVENNTSIMMGRTIKKDTSDNISPFVSNELDEFLNLNSSLRISYDIPKLDAEDGLVTAEDTVPATLMATEMKDDKTQINTSFTKKVPEIKAKTLAEKRRILEKINKETMKKQNVTGMKREHERENLDDPIPTKKLYNKKKQEWNIEKYGYVLYSNKKIWLPTRTNNVFIGEISEGKLFLNNDKLPSSKKPMQLDTHKRPSLLNELQKNIHKPLKYKPGPLSKKPNLCVEANMSAWKHSLKELPQVYLDVVPERGKEIPPNIQHLLPDFGWEVNEVRINFALTAVKDNKMKPTQTSPPKQFFRMPVNYANNQKTILVRKKVQEHKEEVTSSRREVKPNQPQQKRPACLEDEIKDIVEDLLNYIETKEIEDSIIRNDEPISYDECRNRVTSKKPTKINENISTIVRKDPKKRKIDLELLRLNCKVINVTLEESDENNCKKPYCQMGCVCQSLRCENVFPIHCRKAQCMFECSCPKQKSVNYDAEVVLPAGTDLYSSDAVSKIDNRAKQNLAKVEREFTQTIIYANDKTIVVSAGGRDKLRRATKTPKKYTDYVEEEDADEKISSKSFDKTQATDPKLKLQCDIPLKKLELGVVVPFCLTHEQYDCFCKGKSPFSLKSETKKYDEHQSTSSKSSMEITKGNLRRKSLVRTNSVPQTTEEHRTTREHRTTKEPKTIQIPSHVVCARFKGVFHKYKERNSQPKYRRNLLKFVASTSSDSFLVDDDDISHKPECLRTDAEVLIAYLRKRKLDESVDVDKSIQKLGRPPKHLLPVRKVPISKPRTILSKAVEHHSKPIFDGEVIIPVARNKEFLKVLSISRVPEGYIRILPWINLVTGYKSGAIQVFRHKINPHMYLMCMKQLKAPVGYVPLFGDDAGITDFGRWIKEGIFPVQKTFLYIVLVPYDIYFHILAFCLNSFDEKNKSMVIVLLNEESSAKNSYLSKLKEAEALMIKKTSLSPSKHFQELGETVISSNIGDNRQSLFRYIDDKKKKELSSLERYIHKTADGKRQMLNLVQHDLKNLETVELEYQEENDEKEEFKDGITINVLKVHLPPSRGRWRMVYMRSDFTYLTFNKKSYSIKYTDLKSILRLAMGLEKTVSLHGKELSEGFRMPLFGIYTCHLHNDKIFIGPYDTDEAHNLDTMRYMRQSLVTTEVFNKVQGKAGNRISLWLRNKNTSPVKDNDLLTIDLTSDDTPETLSPTKSISAQSNGSTSPRIRSILKRPLLSQSRTEDPQIKKAKTDLHESTQDPAFSIMPGDALKSHQFNRYILTNIPHLGYIGALLNSRNGEILVSWVFHDKTLMFSSVNKALLFLEQRLCMLLQPIPLTFKIKFVLMKTLDLGVHKPIDKKYLNGHYICGEFGVYDVKALTQEVLQSIGVDREEVVDGLTKRVQNIIIQRMKELSLIVHGQDNENSDSRAVLSSAKDEISKLENEAQMLIVEKNILENSKSEKVQTLHKILDCLPQHRRLIEYNKFKCYTNYSGKRIEEPPLDEDCIDLLDSVELYANKADASIGCSSGAVTSKENSDFAEITPVPAECIEIIDSDDDIVISPESSRSDSKTSEPQSVSKMPKLTEVFGKKTEDRQKKRHSGKIKLKPLPDNFKFQSLLKPKMTKLPSNDRSSPTPFIRGVKVVKTDAGKLVLVKTPRPQKQEKGGTKIVIKNNKVISVSSIKDKS